MKLLQKLIFFFPYRAHPHKIVGKDGCVKGFSEIEFDAGPGKVLVLEKLGIQFVKRKSVLQSLTDREKRDVDPFNRKS